MKFSRLMVVTGSTCSAPGNTLFCAKAAPSRLEALRWSRKSAVASLFVRVAYRHSSTPLRNSRVAPAGRPLPPRAETLRSTA